MKKIALTGGIACGKSLIGLYMIAEGIPVCDADRVAHEVMMKGSPVHAAILREFGANMVRPDGEIDRVRLGRIVFSEPDRRVRLNNLTHPAVKRAIGEWLNGLSSSIPMAVVIIPLLYETGMEEGWDGVVSVASPVALQMRRLMERGLSETDARLRLEAQWPQAEKMDRADWVIFNNGTKGMLKEQVRAVLQRIVER